MRVHNGTSLVAVTDHLYARQPMRPDLSIGCPAEMMDRLHEAHPVQTSCHTFDQ